VAHASPDRRAASANVKTLTEIELKFLVPDAARATLAAEIARGSATLERRALAAMYLDTADRRLAQHGIAWRLRSEDRRWVQALKAGGTNALQRFEHEVVRPDATHDASEHAGTPIGDQLIAVLQQAEADGVALGVRFQTDVRRMARRVRTRGAVVEVALDKGQLSATGATQRIHEVEFELVSGSATAMLALVERWRHRFGLVYDPRSKAERGDRLAEGSPFPPVRKANPPRYADTATATEALGAVVDECLAHMTRNAIAVTHGDPALRVEHVHQLRVGIRRLRSALRSFQGWAPSPPADLVDGLRALFTTLGLSRDRDVLATGVMAELARQGAPALTLSASSAGPDPVAAVSADATQRTLLGWIAWRASLAEPLAAQVEEAPAPDDAPAFHHHAERRLARWHRHIVAAERAFDALDDAGLHALRKRIKRQRYAVEFFAPVLRRRQVERYLKLLTAVQDRMGELNDLFVARDRYQALVASDPAAWFALGWLAARVAQSRALAKPELERLAKGNPPKA